MRVAAQAFHFEIAEPGSEGIAEGRLRLRRTLKAEHALVPCVDGEPVGYLARFRCPFSRRPNRSAINGFT